MKSIKEIYRIGTGPSSSHTMAPRRAAGIFYNRYPDASSYRVTLYGSLAATGKGHMTDVAIKDVIEPHAPLEIVWEPKIVLPFHPNGMKFEAFAADGSQLGEWTVFSIGGGALAEEGDKSDIGEEIYPMTHMSEILDWCRDTGRTYWEYVEMCEGPAIWDYNVLRFFFGRMKEIGHWQEDLAEKFRRDFGDSL